MHWAKKEAISRYKETELVWGKLIEEMIQEGSHMRPILQRTGLKLTYFRRFLNWYSPYLKSVLASNSVKNSRENALKNSIKGAEKTKGKELKPLTTEAHTLFQKLLMEGVHIVEIERRLAELGFGKKKVKQLAALYGHPKRCDQSGENNPMFGRSLGLSAGVGVSGWLYFQGKKIHFRSTLEMKIYLYLLANEVSFEISKHRIPYVLDGKSRTYCPDYVTGTEICEIKPFALIELPENVAKFAAAKQYCAERALTFKVITERTYKLPALTEKEVLEMREKKLLLIEEKNMEKMKRKLI